MPTRIHLPDGRTLVVETNDPAQAERAGQRFLENERTRATPEYQRAYSGARQTRQRLHPDQNGPQGMFANFTDQIFANLGVSDEMAAASAYLGQGAGNLMRRVRGQEPGLPASLVAQAAGDYEQDRAADYAREHPNLNTASIVASVPASAGTPAAAATRVGALRAGVAAAGIDAPFAYARQEGDLAERTPGAAREIATVGGIGSGLTALANGLAPRVAPRVVSRAAEFERARVRPTMAALSGGTPAAVTKMIGENFAAGGGVRRRLAESLSDTADAARNLSARAGQAGPRETVGEGVQQGVRRFAQDRNAPQPRRGDPRGISTREWSFPAKARALYDDVFGRLAYDEEQMVGAVQGPILSLDRTRQTLAAIESRVHGPASRAFMENPRINQIARALESDETLGELRFRDLREWRSWVRRAQREEGLRQSMDNADLQRLEGALTEDIYTSALSIGGQAANDLRRVDRWYRAGQRRIQTALEPFAQGGGAQAYRRIIDLASQGGRENSRALAALRNSLRPDEMRNVAATVIDELGNPSFGSPHVMEPGAFSVDRFVTNYARLSEEGKTLLFGPLRGELDNLARVAGYQKGVEAMANRSRSGVNAQNFGTLAGFATPGGALPTAGALGAMALTGEALTNPAFVRWLVSAAKAGSSVGGMRQQLAGLARIAARDPALAPLYSDLSQKLGAQFDDPGRRQPQHTELVQ